MVLVNSQNAAAPEFAVLVVRPRISAAARCIAFGFGSPILLPPGEDETFFSCNSHVFFEVWLKFGFDSDACQS